MTIDIDQYRLLKRKVEEAKSEYGRAEGALAQLMKKLKEDFDCDTIEDAKTLLAKKVKERDEAEREYGEKLDEFNKRWSDRL